MATYNNFGCNEFFNNLYEQVNDISKSAKENYDFITSVFTKQNIKTVISAAKDSKTLDNLEKLKELKTIIDKIIQHTNIKKIKFDFYNKKITEETGSNPLDKLVASEKYNNPKYLYYYTLQENNKKPLPYSKIALLSLKINPLHFYLNSLLVTLYQQFCKYCAFLDCFFEIENVPNFFTEYCAKLGLNGLHILDIEIILGLLTKLLLLDFAKETYPEYDEKTSKIININNVFDIFFKWEHIDKNKLFKPVTLAIIKGIVNKKIGIDEKIKNIITMLFQILSHDDKNACEKLYNEGLMSISVYIAYVIKSVKTFTPVLSFSHLGYLDDLSTQIIKMANDNLNHDKKNIQKGGIIGVDNVLGFVGLMGTLETLGLFHVINMIFNTLKDPIYSCFRRYYSEYKLDISGNISFYDLSHKLIREGDNIIINMINGTDTQPKLSYLSIFLQTFCINDNITKMDKLLLNIKHSNDKSPFSALSLSYKITTKLIKAPTIIETGFFTIDVLYLVFSENSSLFKIYDTLIKKLSVETEDYKFGDEIERVAKVIFSFIDKLLPTTRVILRQKILSFIIIQNLYLLAEKYKNTDCKKKEFYTLPNTTDPNKINIFDSKIYKICKIITDIICITPDKHNKHLDKINEFILACLGRTNELFDSELTEILAKLVDYNFKLYREYIVSVKLSIISKGLLFAKMQPIPHTVNTTTLNAQSQELSRGKNDLNLSGTVCTGIESPAQCNPTGVTQIRRSRHSTSDAMGLELSVSGTTNINSHRNESSKESVFVSFSKNSENQNNANITKSNVEDTSFFSVKTLTDFSTQLFNKSKQKIKKTINTTKNILHIGINTVYDSAANIRANFLSVPNPEITHIVELSNSIHASKLNDELTRTTIENNIDTAFNNIDEAFESSTINDNHNTNKQKVHLFVSKLFEYVLYISLPNIESKLGYKIKDNVMICNESDILLNHLNNTDTNLLFETTKQSAKIRFITY